MSKTPRDILLAKIKKCLALSKSANEHEAAAALEKARQLMDEYGVDQADIDLADVEEARAKGTGAWTPAAWEGYLIATVRRAIPCQTILEGEVGYRFIGITPAPEIAAYAFGTLFRKLRKARSDYMANHLKRCRTAQRKTARADAFAEGWAIAVHAKIAALYPKQETDALVRKYIAERFPRLTTVETRSSNVGAIADQDRSRGYDAGENVDLNVGVGASTAPLALA